jgi:hypothetical protein
MLNRTLLPSDRVEPHLFHFDDLLGFLRLAFAALLFILELTEVHDAADRRDGIGRDLDKVLVGGLCEF